MTLISRQGHSVRTARQAYLYKVYILEPQFAYGGCCIHMKEFVWLVHLENKHKLYVSSHCASFLKLSISTNKHLTKNQRKFSESGTSAQGYKSNVRVHYSKPHGDSTSHQVSGISRFLRSHIYSIPTLKNKKASKCLDFICHHCQCSFKIKFTAYFTTDKISISMKILSVVCL